MTGQLFSMDRVPTHVVAKPGDRRSLCGVKNPLPVVWEPFVDAHVKGHGMIVCPACQGNAYARPVASEET